MLLASFTVKVQHILAILTLSGDMVPDLGGRASDGFILTL
jgi:hypothetical protein